jgi:exopolysaccharide production protein ExoQ
MALVSGGHVAIGVGAGGEAFSGLTESKNLLADIASTGLIVSLAVIAMAVRGKAWLWLGFGVVAAAMQLYAVSAARSAGAVLGLGIGVMAFGALLALIAAGRVVRAWLTSVLAVVLVGVGLNYGWLSQLMIQTAADVFDKDPTLTGRTYLWYRAADLIQEKPLLGRGYQAFWLQGNMDAEGLWRYFDITIRSGFTFHNTLVEILVTLGWLGVFVVGAVVVASAVVLIRRFVVRPNLALCFWTAIFLYQLARTPIESIGLAPFYFSTALAFAALGAAWGRADSRKLASRPAYVPPQPRVVQAWPVEEIPAQWSGRRWRPAPGSQRLRLAATRAPR